MAGIWLIVWLIEGTPAIHFWESWTITLVAAVALSIFSRSSSNA